MTRQRATCTRDRKRHHTPHGSIGLVLVMASLTVFLLLPLLTGLVRVAYSQMMIVRAGALLDETLPSASLCLDPDRLAEGELDLDPAAVDAMIRSRLAATLPSVLAGRLEVVFIRISWQPIPISDHHWLAERQPGQIPVVSCTVRILPLAGDPFLLTRSVKVLQTPD